MEHSQDVTKSTLSLFKKSFESYRDGAFISLVLFAPQS